MSASRPRVGRPAPADLSKEWLSAEVRRLGSLAAVAAAHQMNAQSLRLAARRLGVRDPRPYERSRPERPEFFDEKWIRWQFEQHGSYFVVAEKYGYDWAALMAAGTAFGIDDSTPFGRSQREEHVSRIDAAWLRAELKRFGSLRKVARWHNLPFSQVAAAAKAWSISNKAKKQASTQKAEKKVQPAPDYLDEAWLRAQLERQPLVSRVALQNGLPLSVVTAAVRKYEIDVQSEYWAKQQRKA